MCPNVTGTELVYDGLTAGTSYNHGGGAEYVCTAKGNDAEYQPEATTRNAGRSFLFAAEYETISGQALDYLDEHNAPCAVCEVTTRSKQIMIPGRYTCPDTWTVEYSGWLMSASTSHHRAMFMCLDKTPETVIGREASNNGVLLYHVEAVCSVGQLPCPHYDDTKELACVVCTK